MLYFGIKIIEIDLDYEFNSNKLISLSFRFVIARVCHVRLNEINKYLRFTFLRQYRILNDVTIVFYCMPHCAPFLTLCCFHCDVTYNYCSEHDAYLPNRQHRVSIGRTNSVRNHRMRLISTERNRPECIYYNMLQKL